HPNEGGPADPFPYLQKAVHLLVPVNPKTTVSLSVAGKVARTAGNRITVSLTSLTLLPGSQKLDAAGKSIVLAVPSGTQIDAVDGTVGTAAASSLPELTGGQVVVLTAPARATLAVAVAKPGAISAARIAAVALVGHGGP